MAHHDGLIAALIFLSCIGIGTVFCWAMIASDKRNSRQDLEQEKQQLTRDRADLELSLLPFARTGTCPVCRYKGKWKMEKCTQTYYKGYQIPSLTYILTSCKQCGHQLRRRTAEDAQRTHPPETPEQAARREVDEIAPDA